MQNLFSITFTVIILAANSAFGEVLNEDFNFKFCQEIAKKYYSLISKIDSISCDVEYSSFNDIKTGINQNQGKSKYLKAVENVAYKLTIYVDGRHRFVYDNFQTTGDIAFDQTLLSTTSQLKQIVDIVIDNWRLFTLANLETLFAADSMYDYLSFYQVNYADYQNGLKYVTANISKDYRIQKLTFTTPDSSSQFNIEPVFELFEDKLAIKAFKYYDLSGSASVAINFVNDRIDDLYLPIIAAVKFKMMGIEMNNTVYFKNYRIDLRTKKEHDLEIEKKILEIKKQGLKRKKQK